MSSTKPLDPAVPATPAATQLMPRAREILQVLAQDVEQALAGVLERTPGALERELFEAAERARNSQVQADIYTESRALNGAGPVFARRFLDTFLPPLLALRRIVPEPVERTAGAGADAFTLTLVEDKDVDRDIVLHDIARRLLAVRLDELHLLGQRFGVLDGAAAFEVEQLPLAPLALIGALRNAGQALQIGVATQLQLYRVFERLLLPEYGRLLQLANRRLDAAGILPGLVYQPHLARTAGPRPHAAPAPTPTGEVPPSDREAVQRPLTRWSSPPAGGGSSWASALFAGTGGNAPAPAPGPGSHGSEGGIAPGMHAGAADLHPGSSGNGPGPGFPAGASGDRPGGWNPAPMPTAGSTGPAGNAPASPLATLQGLLQAARQHAPQAGLSPGGATPPGAVVAAYAEVNGVLGELQARPPAGSDIAGIRQALLDALQARHGKPAALAPRDADTFDLLGLLFASILREVRAGSPARQLLDELQVPVVRAALGDPAFFVRDQHPARELLNNVAEAGATWAGEDETDPQTLVRLEQAVQRVVKDYDGDEAVLEAANREIHRHAQAQARKAEVTERRHVEAARGKERLDMARQSATAAVERGMEGRDVPRFVQSLLRQAWADVLTLTVLRHGERSPEWQARDEATRRIAEVTAAGGAPDLALGTQVEEALLQVGYHRDEAGAIARRLSTPGGEDEATSRTELAAKLKARTRLGEQQAEAGRKPALAPRTAAEQALHGQLRVLPFGTWFEFTTNQQGDLRRQRLSWYSLITDNALFVNQRGQKATEMTLDALARLMARGQARIVTEERARLIDRAWQATVRMLRNLAGQADNDKESAS